eukprot:g3214.t1
MCYRLTNSMSKAPFVELKSSQDTHDKVEGSNHNTVDGNFGWKPTEFTDGWYTNERGLTFPMEPGLRTAQLTHLSGNNLVKEIVEFGNTCKTSTVLVRHILGGKLSYNDLINKLILPGEKIQIGGVIQYDSILSDSGYTIGNGMMVLTDRRLLALSAQPTSTGCVKRHGKNKMQAVYETSYEAKQNIQYIAYPLEVFKQASLEYSTSSEAKGYVIPRNTSLCARVVSCLTCQIFCAKYWLSSPLPHYDPGYNPNGSKYISSNSTVRKLRLHLLAPPWGKKTRFVISIAKGVGVEKIVDFLSKLQALAPSLNGSINKTDEYVKMNKV